ncbi:MAG: sigma-70 family RNA polymerase sigma factor, partial [Saprospiraceae bacterium]
WKSMKDGDHHALKSMYDAHISNLINYAKKFTSDHELIEDAIHDMFVYLWNKRATIGDTDCIIKYLCVMLRRDIIKRLDKAKKQINIDSEKGEYEDFTINIEDLLILDEDTKDQRLKLSQALSTLSGRQREAIYLKYFEEMDYEGICDIMNINYQSVRNLISKGIIELRKAWITVFFIVNVILKSYYIHL